MLKQKSKSITNAIQLVKADGTVIIQKYFPIKDYNPEALRSINLKDMFDDFIIELQEILKKKDLEFMYDKVDLNRNDFNKKWYSEIKSSYKQPNVTQE